MKGIVFTGFLQMVEEKFSYQMVDDLITSSDLPSEGIYTSVGTYHHTEMVKLVANLSQKTETPISELYKIFGRYFFTIITKNYHHFIKDAPDAFSLLESVQNHIHVEVQKLYSEAELPDFEIQRIDKNTLIMIYTSERKMADLAYGLIEGCMEYYGESGTISQFPLEEDGKKTKFVIIKQ